MISLIVTTRNRPDFLYRCLLAVARQTCKDFECIVVGDHCQYAEAVCRLFDVKYMPVPGSYVDNVGAIGKNWGIHNATGDRICYCDDDNILLREHIRNFDRTAGDYLYSRFMHCNYGDATAYDMLNRPLYGLHKEKTGFLDALTICHSKELWQQVGGWKPMGEVGYNEDGYFMGEMDKVAQRNPVPAVSAIYNSHGKNFAEYNALLPTANPIVYPELINKWI